MQKLFVHSSLLYASYDADKVMMIITNIKYIEENQVLKHIIKIKSRKLILALTWISFNIPNALKTLF